MLRYLINKCYYDSVMQISLQVYSNLKAYFALISLDLVEYASAASVRNKKPPAVRVGDKNYIKKASFALRCRCSSQNQIREKRLYKIWLIS